ncbi:hypothetical protein ACP275_11G110300 [Erythranthe tilingii]
MKKNSTTVACNYNYNMVAASDSNTASTTRRQRPPTTTNNNNPFHPTAATGEEQPHRFSTTSDTATACDDLSPPPTDINNNSNPSFDITSASPLSKSPWSSQVAPESHSHTCLRGSLVRKEGHIYSLAAKGDLLYTGSESKNIRVWKNQREFSGFKSGSGFVKSIIIAGETIFTGHQDGKIRIWKASTKDPSLHKRIGTLPTFRAKFKSSFNPSNYVEVKKHRNAIWIKHTDTISCLSLSEDGSLLYSSSWDRTFKVWRISDSKCLESVKAHEDAVNAVAAGFDGLLFTGSADGSVKVWHRQIEGKGVTRHFLSQTLLKQESAVTSLAVDPADSVLYCGSSDGLVNFWERGKFLSHGGVLRGHKLAVLCVAVAGDLVFSGSADTSICVWRREGGGHVCLSVLTGHGGPVKCLAVEEEKGSNWGGGGGRRFMVYSGSTDKSVKIWRVLEQGAAMQPPAVVTPPSARRRRQQQYVESNGVGWSDFSFVQTSELLHAR